MVAKDWQPRCNYTDFRSPERTTVKQQQSCSLSKRERIARWCESLGFTERLSHWRRRPCLLVVNYHRIGNAAATPYDPGTFSANEEEFTRQLLWLKRCFTPVTLHDALSFVRGRRPIRYPVALVTFDDGYIDNYRCAFPILRAHEIPAVFFLPTRFIESTYIPWWDAIAWQVRTSERAVLRLRYPHEIRLPLNGERSRTLRHLLRLYKQPATHAGQFIAAVEEATGIAHPAHAPDRLFLNWAEAAEMARGGMAIGSHTHSHELVAKLSELEQYHEFCTSRELIREKVGVAPDALAFPVGARTSFTRGSTACLEQAGYRAAFSFYGGVNLPGRIDPFDIRRMAADTDEGVATFRLRLALTAATGHPLL